MRVKGLIQYEANMVFLKRKIGPVGTGEFILLKRLCPFKEYLFFVLLLFRHS